MKPIGQIAYETFATTAGDTASWVELEAAAQETWQKVALSVASDRDRMVEASRTHTSTPERAAKISAAKRGVPRSPETIEKMWQANLGKKHSDEARAKMRASHARRRSKI